ncbi:MAG: Asp-tRNA(Asn)/Glu-tRNA(Gln) amidotransferase subunit GatC [Proteobacteria bacterium]|nr:Asp-tRNA(Asn)/Glu-tRNA(Gln) amidotransferase subunit GatC [Pseudomonadota bacterium]
MSVVSKEDFKKISRLARIEIPKEGSETTAAQVGSIIAWVEKLNEVNTENVEPLTNVHDMSLRLNADEINDGDIANDVLKNAKNAKYGYFAVPKVLE